MKRLICILMCLAGILGLFACESAEPAPIKHRVTLVCNDQTVEREFTEVLEEVDLALPLEGLLGWAENPETKYRTISFPYRLEKDTTLYAVFEDEFDSYLPVMRISTKNVPINSKETYVDARITLSNVSEEHELSTVKAGIRLRGNSTMGYAKKPYRLKFDEKQSLLGEPAHKSWVLLADYLDASLMKNYSALYFAGQLNGMEFTPCAHHVELYLNGKYQGVYLLCDQVQEQKNTRVPIEIKDLGQTQVPFLIEKNYRAERESETEYDWFSLGDYQYTIKYPENLTQQQYDYIVDTYTRAETAVIEHDWEYLLEHVDLNSLYDFYIVNELFFNRDAMWTSCFMYQSLTGKLKFGPVWDFDWSLNTPWINSPTVSTDTSTFAEPYFTDFKDEEQGWCWLMALLEDDTRRSEFSERWKLARTALEDTLEEIRAYRKALEPAAERNLQLWYQAYEEGGKAGYESRYGSIFADQYEFLKEFLTLRSGYFDERFA